MLSCFFFQAEDGIRDLYVTGVQTCALPISEFGGGVFLSNLSSLSASASTIPPSLWTTDPQWHTPYSQQWNLDVQQSLGRGWLFDVGYVGNKGTHLVGVIDINQAAPGAALAAGIL